MTGRREAGSSITNASLPETRPTFGTSETRIHTFTQHFTQCMHTTIMCMEYQRIVDQRRFFALSAEKTRPSMYDKLAHRLELVQQIRSLPVQCYFITYISNHVWKRYS
jgi:hypothetical protein